MVVVGELGWLSRTLEWRTVRGLLDGLVLGRL